MDTSTFYAYYWCVDERNTEKTNIRVYGLRDDKTICLRIERFLPFCYVELPESCTQTQAQLIAEAIEKACWADAKPVKYEFVQKRKLYYASNFGKEVPFLVIYFRVRNHIYNLSKTLARAMRVSTFSAPISLKIHGLDIKPVLQLTSVQNVPTSGWIDFKGDLLDNALKITYCDEEYIVPYKNLKPSTVADKIGAPVCLSFDLEVNSSIPNTFPNANRQSDKIFQISCVFWRYGSPKNAFDRYLLSLGKPDSEIVSKAAEVHLRTFDTEHELIDGFTALVIEKQPNVIMGYNIFKFDIPYLIDRAKRHRCVEFFKMGFTVERDSIERKIKWSSTAFKNEEYNYLDAEGRLFIDLDPIVRRDHAKLDNYTLKTVSTHFLGATKDPLDAKGIFKCYVEGMEAEQPDASDFVRSRGRKALGIVGKYCVQDSVLVMNLFITLNLWTSLCEMAGVCRVTIFETYTQGQQLRVFSQVYRKCHHDGIVIDKTSYISRENDDYVGALVLPPKPGVYDNVVSFDFNSLYPTTIIAYNICWSTLVPDRSKDDKFKGIRDEDCHVMEWEDHIGCPHNSDFIEKNDLTRRILAITDEIKTIRELMKKTKEIDSAKERINQLNEKLKPLREKRSAAVKSIGKKVICEKRYFRFLKSPEGILPNIARNLLENRKKTKNEMKGIKAMMKQHVEFSDKWNELSTFYSILDAKQLSTKVATNSLYGALGVKAGYLPLMPGAMCTTYMGRQSILKANAIMETEYHHDILYNDTDSIYVSMKDVGTPAEIWDHSVTLAEKISATFPKPQAIAFEEHIYQRFFILTKKRYMSIEIDRSGKPNLDENGNKIISKKGVLLQRRDGCSFVRNVYANVVMSIFEKRPRDEILNYVLEELKKLFRRENEPNQFRITKSVGNYGFVKELDSHENEDDFFRAKNGYLRKPYETEGKWKLGDYVVKKLSDDPEERRSQLESKDVTTDIDYYLNCLPAQATLAFKMSSERGQLVSPGARMEFVIIERKDLKTTTQRDTIEDYQYFKRHKDVLQIDYFHYLNALTVPLDEIFHIIFGEKIMKDLSKFFAQREKLFETIRKLRTKLVFEPCVK